ncbi:MAG: T9SS type A sorting domain-containing protein [Ignavibacteriae bacterium]|nr:T9SS type A sorting domain-containing protein [Ignavibacteriota bacterium]
MTHKVLRFSGWILSVAALVLFVQLAQPPAPVKILKEKKSFRSKDNPHGARQFEFMRVRDPKTNAIPHNIREKELAFAKTLPTRESLARVLRKQSGSSSAVGVQALTWTGRGPFNVGGRTRALAVDVSNENVILGGGVSGGMWRSTDGGATWTRTSSLASINQSVTSLVQDTRSGKTNTWYYGTGEFLGGSASGGGGNAFYTGDGIFKSTDGGQSWSILAETSTNIPEGFENFFDYVWNIAVDPSNAAQDEVYAATYGAIFRSTNGGLNWSPVLGGGSPYSPYVDVAVTSGGVVYAALSSGGSAQGIWRSTNGTSWANITPASWPGTYNRTVFGIAPSNENVVYFASETPGGGTNGHSLWKYTYVSGDGTGAGGTWVNRSANIPMLGAPVGDFDSQFGYDLIVKVKPDNENAVFLGGTNLYRSTDGFATTGNTTWIGGYATANDISRYDNHHPDQHSFAFLPSNASIAFSGHDGGISKTTNILASPVTWTSLNSGYFTTQFYTTAIDHGTNGNNVIIGGMQDNGTWAVNSTNSGDDWAEIGSGDGAYCAIADGRTFYVTSVQNGKAYRMSFDGSWQLTDWARIDPVGGSGYLFINPFVIDPNNNEMVYMAAGDRLWRNSDITAIASFSNNATSTNWTELTNTVVTGNLSALSVSRTSANTVYYGTNDGEVYRLDNAHTGNPTPTDVWTGKGFPSGAYVSNIAVDPTNHDHAIVVFSNYEVRSLFSTTNGGSSWTNVSGDLEENSDGSGSGPSCRWAAIVPFDGTTSYFVGTSTGLYSTITLNGTSTVWAQEGSGTIGNVVVDMIDARLSDGLVVAATHANGVYSANIPPAVSVEPVDDGIPASFALLQNYPNPFNPETRIPFSLSQPGHVKLSIVDLAGREVKRLVDESKGAGNYEVRWDATNSNGYKVASGVYFYRLETSVYRAFKKMVLLK